MTGTAIEQQTMLDQKHDFMLRRTYRGRKPIRWCVNCEKTPTIAWNEGAHQYKCDCGYDKAMLGEIPDEAKMKMGELLTTALARRSVESIQVQDVKQFIAPKASDEQILFFLKFCVFENLNPFKNEVYYIPFWNKKEERWDHAIVTGIDTYRKRASRNPLYAGHQAGVIVQDSQSRLQYREGEFMLGGDTLVGGWCDAYIKGAPRPMRQTVQLATYDKGTNVWEKDKPLMISKVAEGHCLKKYFPESFVDMSGTEGYVITDAEFEGEITAASASVIEGQVVDLPAVDRVPCPLDGEMMRKNKWHKWSHATSEKNANGKTIWHNFTDDGYAEAAQEAAQDDAQRDQADLFGATTEESPTDGETQPSMDIDYASAFWSLARASGWAQGAVHDLVGGSVPAWVEEHSWDALIKICEDNLGA